ncbi:alpha/beta hydrolase [Geitlerinema sp. PCC 7407]|uniref:alpha/beta hydrolase n=1 Tax=Geitlerinema sp. PCC 7407 TaxID=1173025 RepID=UPI00029FE84F|nr:alpha/beta hydrolase-fold protein [Geitlerinema sp. PCC 7407]AFY68169.1 esterase [Geitlerinema sp. PCC 7407]
MGSIQILRDFPSPPEQLQRTIRIFTPDAYDQQPDQRFPVLYLFDGQNVFSHPESAVYDTWCANTTLERLVAEGSIRPWIIVAIDHLPNRLEEYSPWIGGRGPQCAEFVVHHLKPYIDQHFRTLPEAPWTGILGASMGGLMALYLGRRFPEIFGRIGGLSPALMWGGGQMFQFWDRHTRHWSKIALHVGSQEQYSFYGVWLDYVPITQDFYRHLRGLGYGDHEVRFSLAEGDIHHETAWQRRLPEILRWLLVDPEGL